MHSEEDGDEIKKDIKELGHSNVWNIKK